MEEEVSRLKKEEKSIPEENKFIKGGADEN